MYSLLALSDFVIWVMRIKWGYNLGHVLVNILGPFDFGSSKSEEWFCNLYMGLV